MFSRVNFLLEVKYSRVTLTSKLRKTRRVPSNLYLIHLKAIT